MFELWDFGDRAGTYESQEVAEADRDWLREDAYMTMGKPGAEPDDTRAYVDARIFVKELRVLTKARFAGKPHYALRD